MQRHKSSLVVILVLFSAFYSGCSSAIKVTKDGLKKTLAKSIDNWTLEECEGFLAYCTAYNKEGLNEKINERTKSYCDVYLKALPLQKNTIFALARKEAILKRFDTNMFRERLKEYFEKYTKYTIDIGTGLVGYKPEIKDTTVEELSFQVTFENVSRPYHTIEVDRADEGFFIENSKGEFGRVIGISGYYIDETFLLSGEMRTVITFSLFKDNGEPLFNNQNIKDGYKLMFNGLQTDSIVIEWLK